MDFHLSKEHLLVRKMYREFAENEVKPLAEELDEEERFPMETVEKMAKLGMMGIYFPKQYGGAGADVLSYAMCVEELAKVCGTTAVIVSAHTSLCCAPIFENGTEEQKMKYLPDLCSGRKIGAFGLTEPGAGTDAQGQQTTAVLDESGENYILNGSKCFITNGNVADTFVIIAVTGKTTDKRGRTMKEISAFIVEKDDKGFSQGKHEKKMGIRGSSTCDLIFEDCVIPKDRMLGKKGEGFKIAMTTLDGGRIGIASQALGIGEGAVEEAIKYTKERVQFGKRISQFQNTQFQLADMHTRMQAAQYVVYAAAMKKQTHEPYSMDAAMAKLFAAEAASDVTRRAVQLFGGYGYTMVYLLERKATHATFHDGYATSADGRIRLAEHIRKLPLGFLMSKDSGELGNTMMNDFSQIEEGVTHILPQLISGIIVAFLALFGMAFADWRMALAMFAGLPVTFLILWGVRVIDRKRGAAHTKARIEQTNRLQEYLTGMKVIKA